MNDAQMTLVGNLVEDPELRFTPAGQPVAKFRVASTPRYRDNATGEWKDGDSLFLTCTTWRQTAENAAESLTRGMRVIVTGRLKQRSYETKEGEKRTVYELEADELGPSLRNASAKVQKVTRSGGNGGQAATAQGGSGGKDADPWAVSAPGGYSDEPPF
jgi:single-strand DNA-binding protein